MYLREKSWVWTDTANPSAVWLPFWHIKTYAYLFLESFKGTSYLKLFEILFIRENHKTQQI